MPDARLRDEWLTADAHDGLSDPAYRILHNALMLGAGQGTDGAIGSRQVRFLYPGTIEPAWLDELVHAGFWERTPDGYQLIGWSTTLGQSTAAEIESGREKARQRARKSRQGAKTTPNPTPPTKTSQIQSRAGARAGERTPARAPARNGERAPARNGERAQNTLRTGQDRTVVLSSPVLTDLTETNSSQSPPTRANEWTDADASVVTNKLAGQLGVTSLRAVANAVDERCARRISADGALQVSRWILDKRATPPDAPQRYVIGAVNGSPAEVQQHIDESGIE